MRRFSPLVGRAVVANLLVLFVAVGAWAQVQTGNIFGTVQTRDGAPLPGVTVMLTGVGAPQTFITDSQGRFRFLNLSPGTYQLRAELAGLGTAARSGIGLSIGQNPDITLQLNPAMEQAITVTAEAPLLDVRRTGTGATMTSVELEEVPTARDPWVILQQTPGVLVDRINVGGNESGQQSQYIGKGAVGTQATWNVDGVNITDVGALGSSPTYYDFDAFEEMQVATGGTDIRVLTPGVQLNMVTKRGTNDVEGSARYFNTSGEWQSDPTIPTEATYLTAVNEIDDITEMGIEAGFPIIRDRLWLWGAYSDQQIDLLTTQTIAGARFIDKTALETINAKLNAQLWSSNSLSIAAMKGDKIKLGRNVSASRPPETAWNQSSSYPGPTMWKIEDTQIFGSNFYLTGLYSHVEGGFQLIADTGRGCTDITCALEAEPAYLDVSRTLHPTSIWQRGFYNYLSDRPQDQMRADAASFFQTGSLNHELKFGLGVRDSDVRSYLAWAGHQYMVFYDQPGTEGATGGVAFSRPMDFTYNVKQTDFYVGDTMLIGNLTVQAGLRWDNQVGTVASGGTIANPTIPDILPELRFEGSDLGELEWNSISPRVGLTYALGAERRTLLRAAANRYVDQMGGSIVYLPSPVGYQYLYYYFTDVNGNRRVDRDDIDFDTGIVSFYGVDPSNPTAVDPPNRWDPDMKPPRTDELIFGLEHQLSPTFVLGGNVTWRKLKDLSTVRYEKTRGAGDFLTAADYVERGVVEGTLPNGEAYSLPYYSPETVAPYGVVTNLPGYSQEYRGVELNATKRMSNRWMLRGNLSFNDWTQDVGDETYPDPTRLRLAGTCSQCDGGIVSQGSGSGSGAKGGIYINSKWAYNLTGLFEIPVIETTLGVSLNGRQGYPIPYVHRVTVPNESAKQILVTEDIDDFRHDDIQTLDLRLAKDVRLGPVGVVLSVDAFNVFNQNTILQRNTGLFTTATRANPGANQITELVSPRVFRLGARLTF